MIQSLRETGEKLGLFPPVQSHSHQENGKGPSVVSHFPQTMDAIQRPSALFQDVPGMEPSRTAVSGFFTEDLGEMDMTQDLAQIFGTLEQGKSFGDWPAMSSSQRSSQELSDIDFSVIPAGFI